ncbi:MAG: hypothetical protein CW691_10695 [Candidatus Bathyarchaeum sp.]|nr:MAG: hypothetical protein CW691_10695 [Candidatus Bathyarchaeum sp.]
MNSKINLKEIERKAYTSYHQDGILEITIAFVILMFAAVMLAEMPWLGGVAGALAVSLYAGIKKLVTVPRMGYVKFSQQRTKKITALILVLGLVSMVAGIFAFMQTTSSGTPEWLLFVIDNYMLTIGIAVSSLFLLGGYAFKINRIYAYALLTLTLFFGGHFISFPVYYYLTVLGSIVLTVGLVMMIRFVHKYPKATETVDA